MDHWCMTDLDISDMPTLYKVCVWVMPFPPDPPPGSKECKKILIKNNGSPNVYFTADCN